MLQHLYQNERTTRLARVLALMIAASFIFAVFAAAADFFMCYEVSIDGEVVGYVESEENFSSAKDAVEDYAESVLGHEYALPVATACTLRLMPAASETDPAPIVDAMLAEVTEIVHLYMLCVDGVEIGGNADKAVVEAALDAIVDRYTRGDEISDVAILNEIAIVCKDADVSYAHEYDELLAMLQENDLIRVSATYKRSALRDIKRGTTELYDDTQYLDYEQITEGCDGVEEVYETYTLVNGVETESAYLETVVLQEAVNDVIVRGTMEIPATRPTGTYIHPVAGDVGKFTSDFGKRGRYEKHTGVDIAARSGTDVFASDSGKVTFAKWKGNYGYYIIIEHGDGVETRYAHLRKMHVKVGDEVVQGQVIAQVGSTGRSTGPHLHFEILQNGEFVNPNDYIDMSVYQDYR